MVSPSNHNPTAPVAAAPTSPARSTLHSYFSSMRFNLISQASQPRPTGQPQPQSSEPVPPLPTAHQPSMLGLSPPLPPLPDAATTFIDENVALAQFYQYTAPDNAIGQAASAQQSLPQPPPQQHPQRPSLPTLHMPYPSSTLHPATHPHVTIPTSPPLPPLLSSPSPHQHSTTTTTTIHTTHTTHLTHALPTTPDDTETNMRRAVLTDPFNLFCPAGLSTLPSPLSGGAFLPLRFVETARSKAEELQSGPCWSLYLYGPQEKVVAFCLHEECVKARQEVNPFKGSPPTPQATVHQRVLRLV